MKVKAAFAAPTACFSTLPQDKPDISKLTFEDIRAIVEDAIRTNKFQIFYQPIYSLSENHFVSAEALIRLPTEE